MAQGGFRKDEPITVSDVIPISSNSESRSSSIGMSVIGGNHRCCAARMSGIVLIWTFIIPLRSLKELYDVLSMIDEKEKRHCSEYQRWQRVLRKLTVPCQIREPAPRPTLVLEQVAMLRTYCEDSFQPAFDVNNNISFGNAKHLRKTMFDADKERDINMNDSSFTHFLLNRRHTNRYSNKLVRGAGFLIHTSVKSSNKDVNQELPILDSFLNWERKRLVGPFRETYLSNVSQMNQESIRLHVVECSEALRNKRKRNTNYCPFANHVTNEFKSGQKRKARPTDRDTKNKPLEESDKQTRKEDKQSIIPTFSGNNNVTENPQKRRKLETELKYMKEKFEEFKKDKEDELSNLHSEISSLGKKLKERHVSLSYRSARRERTILPSSVQMEKLDVLTLQRHAGSVAACIKKLKMRNKVFSVIVEEAYFILLTD